MPSLARWATRTIHEVKTEFEQRAGVQRIHPGGAAEADNRLAQFTTPEMAALERDNIARMRLGQGTMGVLASPDVRRDVADHYHI